MEALREKLGVPNWAEAVVIINQTDERHSHRRKLHEEVVHVLEGDVQKDPKWKRQPQFIRAKEAVNDFLQLLSYSPNEVDQFDAMDLTQDGVAIKALLERYRDEPGRNVNDGREIRKILVALSKDVEANRKIQSGSKKVTIASLFVGEKQRAKDGAQVVEDGTEGRE